MNARKYLGTIILFICFQRLAFAGNQMDSHEVTYSEYRDCEVKLGCTIYPSVLKNLKSKKSFPVSGIRWFDAAKYCHLNGKRLPSVQDYLITTNHPDFIYPWGNERPTDSHANICDYNCNSPWRNRFINDGFEKEAPIKSFEKGKTPKGIYDLAGNLWEWTRTRTNGQNLAYKDKEEYNLKEKQAKFFIKGGSYGSSEKEIKNDYQSESPGNYRSSFIGFRCIEK